MTQGLAHIKSVKPNFRNSNQKETTHRYLEQVVKGSPQHQRLSNKQYLIVIMQPGPGSYQVNKRKAKKTKYIKIRKDFYESQPNAKQDLELTNPLGVINKPVYDKSNYSSMEGKSRKQKSTYLNYSDTFYFRSKVDRFLEQKS